jgi:hypothetical protein
MTEWGDSNLLFYGLPMFTGLMKVSRLTFLRFIAALFFVISFIQGHVVAWDADGHQLIAAMAYGRLNPKAQKEVTDLAREIQTPAQSYDAVTIACWMDDLRKNDARMPYHGLFLSWHYIDLGIEMGDPKPSWEPGDDNELHGNVVQALKRTLVVLRGGADPYIKTKAMACAMVVHLVGDIHQPLHAATHYFRTLDGRLRHDAGGNKEDIVNGPMGDSKFNLHAFWDSAWRASFNEASGDVVFDERYQDRGVHDPEIVRPLAEILVKQVPPSNTDLETHIDEWAWESNRLAKDFAYREIMATESPKYCRLSSGYVSNANAMARQRLVLAAYRLAVLLNNTLGADAPTNPPPSYPPGPPSQL